MKKRIMMKLIGWLMIFGAGAAAGFYVRDQQQHEKIRQAVEEAREELMERGRRAGEDIRAGAQVAADSARAAVREMIGDTAN